MFNSLMPSLNIRSLPFVVFMGGFPSRLQNLSSGAIRPGGLLFTYGTDVLLSPITRIFNVCLSNGLFPSRWSEGLIVPLYKKGDVNVPSNYRGITLLSVFGKLYTKLINNRLNKWAECYEILIEAQAGFRKLYSTVDQIFALNGIISHILNTKKTTIFCVRRFSAGIRFCQ